MPYCIHCGVKVGDRYNRCPLCQIKLEFPEPQKESFPLYPKEISKISAVPIIPNSKEWINVHLAGFFVMLIILLNAGIDFYMNRTLTWSKFSSLSSIFVYTVFSSIEYLKRSPALLYTAINSSIALFLYIMDLLMPSKSWFVQYALPCFISLQIISVIINLLVKKVKSRIDKSIIILSVINVFLLLINELISHNLQWALITTSVIFPTIIFLAALSFVLKNPGDSP